MTSGRLGDNQRGFRRGAGASADPSAIDLTVLATRVGPLHLPHPVINASGTLDLWDVAASLQEAATPRRGGDTGPGFAGGDTGLASTAGDEYLAAPPVGAYVPKTVTLHRRRGNEPPRVIESPAGMLNSIGLPNAGLDAFLEHDLDPLLALPRPLIINLGGFGPDEFALAAERLHLALEQRFVDREAMLGRVGIELNVSCPNVHSGCMSIGTSPEETAETTRRVRAVWPGLLAVKLTPNVTEIAPIARAAVDAGASAITLVNTFKGLALDRLTLTPYLGGGTGGLSGPAVKPLALRFVHEVAAELGAGEGTPERPTEVPIIGMGGVALVQDVVDFLACGATAVAIGAAAFRDPMLYLRLAEELALELEHRGLRLHDLVGASHRGGVL